MPPRTADDLLSLFEKVSTSIRRALDGLDNWEPLGVAGSHSGQYRHDVVADDVALSILDSAGVGVLSEESGLRRADAGVVVIIDPIDGSSNASRGLPWFATSLCAVDEDGPIASMIVNQATGVVYTAVRGEGARRNGLLIKPRTTSELAKAFVALSGLPPRHLGWRQFRCLGAAALDLCGVADGTLDAFIDCSRDSHGVWDYAGAFLVCQEAGVPIVDAVGRELLVLDPAVGRTPIAACTTSLLADVQTARQTFD